MYQKPENLDPSVPHGDTVKEAIDKSDRNIDYVIDGLNGHLHDGNHGEILPYLPLAGGELSGELRLKDTQLRTYSSTEGLQTLVLPSRLEFTDPDNNFDALVIPDLDNNAIDLMVNGKTGLSVFEDTPPTTQYSPTSANQLTRKDYVDTFLPLDGGTLTGSLLVGDGVTGEEVIIKAASSEDNRAALVLEASGSGSGLVRGACFYSGTTGQVVLARYDTDGLTIQSEIILGSDGVSISGPGGTPPVIEDDQDIATKKYVDEHGGGGGVVTSVNGQIGDVLLDDEYFTKTSFLDVSSGAGDAGAPVKLNSQGAIDASMMDVSAFYYVGPWTPTAGAEYPDTTGQTPGAFWAVQELSADYTFTGGELAGKTVSNGDFMVWAAAGWSIMVGEMNPLLYYKLDGTQALTAEFAGGGQQIKNIAAATEAGDGVEFDQWSTKNDSQDSDITTAQTTADSAQNAADAAQGDINSHTGDSGNPHGVSAAQAHALPEDAQAVDSALLAGMTPAQLPISDATQAALYDKEPELGNPTVNGQILSSLVDGTRSWIDAPSGGGAVWGEITGTLSEQIDLQDALDDKSDINHNHDGSYLPADGTAANSLKLGGVDAAGYAPKATVSTSDPSGGSDGDVWYKV